MNARLSPRFAVLLLAAAALLWAGNQIAGRAVVGHVPPVGLAVLRWSLALLVLLPFTLGEMLHQIPWIRRHLGLLLLASFGGVAAFNTLFYIALTRTQAVNAGIANSLIPVAILLLAWAVDGRRPSRRQGLGVGLSLLGCLAVLARGSLEVLGRFAFEPFDLLLLAGVLAWGVYSLCLGRLQRPPDLSPLGFLAVSIVLGLPTLLAAWAVELALGAPLPPFDAGSIPVYLYTGLGASIAAFLAWNAGVASLGPARAGITLHLIPVFSIGLSVALLGEVPRPYHAVGLGLILAGVALAQGARSPPR